MKVLSFLIIAIIFASNCGNFFVNSFNFKSINLSHAVAVVSYEWFKNIESKNFQIKRDEKELEFVKKIEVEKFVKQLKSQLQQKGYFWPPLRSARL